MLRRVTIKNYRNHAATVVDFGRFTVLVGPNGAGKSNLVDALHFVNECVITSISLALHNRGGIGAVRRHSRGHPTHFGVRLEMELTQDQKADFSFEIAARPKGAFEVKRERCIVQNLLGESHQYDVESGAFRHGVSGIRPRIEPDRLALSVVSAVEEFQPVYDFLSSMRFYSLVPDQIRQLQEPDEGRVLEKDGSNAAAVLREIRESKSDAYERICRLLAKVVPGTSKAEYVSIGQKETLRFKQDVGDVAPWTFDTLNMSDGTLRVLGILLAMNQVSLPSFIAIEEPESTIHPAALEVLVDILRDGNMDTQVLITTHSPDILDNKAISDKEILVVETRAGRAAVSPVGEVSRKAIRQRLYTPGELFRAGELEPDIRQAEERAQQLSLFPRNGSDSWFGSASGEHHEACDRTDS